MFCNKCGNQLPDDAGFCNKCGAKLGTSEPEMYTPVETQQSESSSASDSTAFRPSGVSAPSFGADAESKKKKRNLLIALAATAGVAIIAVIVFLLLGHGKGTDTVAPIEVAGTPSPIITQSPAATPSPTATPATVEVAATLPDEAYADVLAGYENSEEYTSSEFALYDIDLNGVDELLVRYDSGAGALEDIKLYSYANNATYELGEFWPRYDLILDGEGNLFTDGSDGAAYNTLERLQISSDGTSLITQESWEMEDAIYKYTSDDGAEKIISESEYSVVSDHISLLFALDIVGSLDWQPLSANSPVSAAPAENLYPPLEAENLVIIERPLRYNVNSWESASYSGLFEIGGETYESGIGLFLVKDNISNGYGHDEVILRIPEGYNTVSFVIGPDSSWGNSPDAGESRITLWNGEQGLYDSGWFDYSYYDTASVYIGDCRDLTIALEQTTGSKGTLNIALADFLVMHVDTHDGQPITTPKPSAATEEEYTAPSGGVTSYDLSFILNEEPAGADIPDFLYFVTGEKTDYNTTDIWLEGNEQYTSGVHIVYTYDRKFNYAAIEAYRQMLYDIGFESGYAVEEEYIMDGHMMQDFKSVSVLASNAVGVTTVEIFIELVS